MAAGVVGVLAAMLVPAAPVQAASQNIALYAQLNDTAASGSQARGTFSVVLFASPSSATVGSPLQVLVGANYTLNNVSGATAPANSYELDAVVRLAGVDYTLRGSRNTAPVPVGQALFNAGWIISSTAGTSSSTAVGAVAGTTGTGSTLRGVEGSPFALAAPGTAGTYTFGLKALILNNIASGGTAALTDLADEITNADPTNAGGGPGTVGPGGPSGSFAQNSTSGATAGFGNLVFSTPVTVVVAAPNAAIATSTGQDPGVQAIRQPSATWLPPAGTVTLTGTAWANNVSVGGFTVQFCDSPGTTCSAALPATTGMITNSLSTNASGVLSGSIVFNRAGCSPGGCFLPMLATGSRTIKLTQGATVALVPMVVVDVPTVTVVPAFGGPGSVVSVTGSNFNPSQTVNLRGFVGACTSSCLVSTDPVASAGAASSAGLFSGSFTVGDAATIGIQAYQGIPGPAAASNPYGLTAFAGGADRCVAYTGSLTAGPGCTTRQRVELSVLQGRLTQRAYTNATPATSTSPQWIGTSAATSPVAGTSAVNSDPTTVNLGTITSPLAPATILGTLNDITVTDTRGGTNGWTLSATMTPFAGVPSGALPNSALSTTPACSPATASTAWDYDAPGQTAIASFDPTLIAPGAGPGTAFQSFAATVVLCTKSTAVNPTTQSTGGVWIVSAPLTLAMPAFQPAAKYTATMTITLV